MSSQQGERKYNEDSICTKKLKNGWLYVLADGLGGHGHGEVASGTAIKSIMNRSKWETIDDNFLTNAIEGAQEAVLEKQKEKTEYKKMSTTLVSLLISDTMAQWGHIGDSRLYMFRRNRILFQTLDHSVPQMLVRMGEITSKQIRKHPDRNQLLRIIGYPWNDKPYTLSEKVEIVKGDAFLLCSDGFWEYIDEKEMCTTLRKNRTPFSWLREMQTIVKKNGYNKNMDNYSAICIQIE